MNDIYSRLAKNLIGQAEVGNVDIVVLVKNGSERYKLIDTIAYLQSKMKFEAFKKGVGQLEIFGKKINIIIAHKGSMNGMKFGNKQIYNLEV